MKIVGVHVGAPNEPRQDVAAEIVRAVLLLPVHSQFVQQQLGGKKIVAHGRIYAIGIARHGRGVGLLLVKPANQPVFARFEHPEFGGLLLLHRNRRHRHLRAAVDVELDHLADVHSIDMVGPENRNHVRLGLLDQVYVLINGVGGAAVPILALRAHLRGNRNDEVVAEQAGRFPSLA